jgi:hypothetical protein
VAVADVCLGGPGVTALPRPAGHGRRARANVPDAAAQEARIAGERARAARTVAGHALDRSDCRMLLSALGLSALDGKPDYELLELPANDEEGCPSTRWLSGRQLPHTM